VDTGKAGRCVDCCFRELVSVGQYHHFRDLSAASAPQRRGPILKNGPSGQNAIFEELAMIRPGPRLRFPQRCFSTARRSAERLLDYFRIADNTPSELIPAFSLAEVRTLPQAMLIDVPETKVNLLNLISKLHAPHQIVEAWVEAETIQLRISFQKYHPGRSRLVAGFQPVKGIVFLVQCHVNSRQQVG
jgi:hypothetical protein